MTWVVHDQPKYASALSFGVARLFGIFGIGCGDRLRSRYPASNFEYASTNATSATCAYTRTVTDAHAATGSGADATTRSRSIRRGSGRQRRSRGIAQVRHVVGG